MFSKKSYRLLVLWSYKAYHIVVSIGYKQEENKLLLFDISYLIVQNFFIYETADEILI